MLHWLHVYIRLRWLHLPSTLYVVGVGQWAQSAWEAQSPFPYS